MKNKVQDLIITVSAFGLIIMLAVSTFAIARKLLVTQSPVFSVGEEYAYTEIVVEDGDTLWSIARAQVPNEDPRDVVDSMRELNALESANIFPGQVLTLVVKQKMQPLQLVDGQIH